MASLADTVAAAELLRQASAFGDGVYIDVYEALKRHDAEMVPDALPPRTERDIAVATDRLLRSRSVSTLPSPKPPSER